MTHQLRPYLSSLLIGAACASFLLALHLVHLLDRFAKDLAEVLATYEVITSCVVIGSVLLTGGVLAVLSGRKG